MVGYADCLPIRSFIADLAAYKSLREFLHRRALLSAPTHSETGKREEEGEDLHRGLLETMAATSSWNLVFTPNQPSPSSLSWKLSFPSPFTSVQFQRRQTTTAQRFLVFATMMGAKPTILVSEKLGDAGLELLKTFANVDCSYNLSLEELCTKISLCDALIVRSGTKVTREVFESSSGRLKVVGRAGVGIDNVDLSAATEHGCLVVNAPTANTIAAAEHGIALLTAMARNIAQADASIKSGLCLLLLLLICVHLFLLLRIYSSSKRASFLLIFSPLDLISILRTAKTYLLL